MTQPGHLHTCPACHAQPEWKPEGVQAYPAKYAGLPSFAAKLKTGEYTWQSDDTFGVMLYTCSECGSTATDTIGE